MRQDELIAQLESLTNKLREKDEYISKLEERLNNSQEHKKDEYIIVLEGRLQKLQDYQEAMKGREAPIEVTGHWVFELR